MSDSSEFMFRARALAPDFVLEREIGRGGMGVVYLGIDVKLDRPVAIKVLPEALANVPEVRERFLREARTAAKLSHPSIVPIYRADEMGGVVFIVMAYIDGESLADRVVRQRVLAARDVIPILHDVALALEYAHAHGIVHRDIKPENILVERATGHAWVTDFGIARLAEAKPLTATGQVLGTVHYMSPEQISGEAIDGRSDLYSLGVVGFRVLTGRLPFDNDAASAVLVAHVVKAPPKVRDLAPNVPPKLAELIDRCLAKNPAARCDSGRAVAQLLDAAMDEAVQTVTVPSAESPIITEREAQALWSRAAELQALTGVQTRPVSPVPMSGTATDGDRRTLTSGYRLDDAQAAALEAGISERYVARAAAELGLAAAAPNDNADPVRDDSPPGNAWAGAPTAILYEVEVPGEVPESELYILVDTIRRRIGEAGHAGTIGRSVSWSSSSKNRNLQVSIVSRHGKTSIRLDERLPPLAGAIFGGVVGGVGGGGGGFAMPVGIAIFHSVGAAFGIWGVTIGGSYLLARSIYKAQVRKRMKTLRDLAEELAMQARDAIKTLPRVAERR